jgi:glycosyltransferase involved in cell wall biosynthesis
MTAEKMSQTAEVAIVTTCKGRLQYIQRTLPLIVSQSPKEVVVVDYGCPQHVGDWVEANYPNVTVVRVTDDPGFCLSRARNIGARSTSTPWICFTDADVVIASGWIEWMRQSLVPGFFYLQEAVGEGRNAETCGTVLCTRHDYDLVQGYDEMYRGWGGEDEDFYDRLCPAGTNKGFFPAHFIHAISHDDSERVFFQSRRDKSFQHMLSIFYRAAKMQMMAFTNTKTELPADIRRRLDAAVRDAFANWDGSPSRPPPSITFDINCSAWLPPPYKMLKRCSFTLTASDTRFK